MQEQANDIDRRKCDTDQFYKDVERLDNDIARLRGDTDNHGNHFAMVENFVEKYIPIRIQSTCSEVLSYVLPYKEKLKLQEFDKKKFTELHQIILDDDGIPRLAEQLKQIRMNVNDGGLMKLKRTMKGSPNRGGFEDSSPLKSQITQVHHQKILEVDEDEKGDDHGIILPLADLAATPTNLPNL